MSGSERGSSKGSRQADDDMDFGAKIAASIGAGNPDKGLPATGKPQIKVKQTLAPIQARTVVKAGQPVDDDEDLDESKLPQAIEPLNPMTSGRDLFWPITGILGIVILTVSFLSFMLMSRVPTRELTTVRTNPSPSVSPEIDLSEHGTKMVGDGNLPEPTPTPEITPTPSPNYQRQVAPVAPQPEASVVMPPLLPAATVPPPARTPLVVPPPVQRQAVTPPKLPAPIKPSADTGSGSYQVQAGPYNSRSDAEAGSSDLASLGKAIKITEDQGKFWLMLGDTVSQQEDALTLAEQAVQQGHQVIVKKK